MQIYDGLSWRRRSSSTGLLVTRLFQLGTRLMSGESLVELRPVAASPRRWRRPPLLARRAPRRAPWSCWAWGGTPCGLSWAGCPLATCCAAARRAAHSGAWPPRSLPEPGATLFPLRAACPASIDSRWALQEALWARLCVRHIDSNASFAALRGVPVEDLLRILGTRWTPMHLFKARLACLAPR